MEKITAYIQHLKSHHIITIMLIIIVILGLQIGRNMKNRTIVVKSEDEIVTAYLPDSTQVILAPHSSIKYRRKFKKRKLQITNQVHLTMGLLNPSPIFVENKYLKIELNGDEFFINFDDKKGDYSVNAMTGEARIEVKNASGQSISNVKEGFEMRFNAGNSILQTIKTTDPNFLTWQNHTFTFQNHTIEEVMQSLKNNFDTPLKINHPNLKYCTVSGEFPAVMDSIVIGIAQQLHIKYEKTERSYILMGQGCPLADEY